MHSGLRSRAAPTFLIAPPKLYGTTCASTTTVLQEAEAVLTWLCCRPPTAVEPVDSGNIGTAQVPALAKVGARPGEWHHRGQAPQAEGSPTEGQENRYCSTALPLFKQEVLHSTLFGNALARAQLLMSSSPIQSRPFQRLLKISSFPLQLSRADKLVLESSQILLPLSVLFLLNKRIPNHRKREAPLHTCCSAEPRSNRNPPAC